MELNYSLHPDYGENKRERLENICKNLLVIAAAIEIDLLFAGRTFSIKKHYTENDLLALSEALSFAIDKKLRSKKIFNRVKSILKHLQEKDTENETQ